MKQPRRANAEDDVTNRRPFESQAESTGVWLRSRPEGNPQAADFGLREVVLPALDDGTFLVQNQFLSAEPAMRGWITDSNNYLPRVQIGDTMRALAAGVVIESRDAAYAVGDPVMGWFGWQEFSAVSPLRRRIGHGA